MSYCHIEIDINDDFAKEHIATITIDGMPWKIVWLNNGDMNNGRSEYVNVYDGDEYVHASEITEGTADFMCAPFTSAFEQNYYAIDTILFRLLCGPDFLRDGKFWRKNSHNERKADA